MKHSRAQFGIRRAAYRSVDYRLAPSSPALPRPEHSIVPEPLFKRMSLKPISHTYQRHNVRLAGIFFALFYAQTNDQQGILTPCITAT